MLDCMGKRCKFLYPMVTWGSACPVTLLTLEDSCSLTDQILAPSHILISFMIMYNVNDNDQITGDAIYLSYLSKPALENIPWKALILIF